MCVEAPELLLFASGDEWREWLERHHESATEAWLVHYKKGVAKPGISYREALDEALNFGWIDTRLKSLDRESYMLRYVPRRPRSVWSKINKDRAEELIRRGKMTHAGLASVEEARKSGNWDKAYTLLTRWETPQDLRKALAENPQALAQLETWANSHHNQYIHWVNEAKTQATRDKRIAEVVRRSEAGVKPG